MNTKTAQPTAGQMTTGSVVSKDGTRIGYLRLGQGPAAVLLHGSNESARSHTGLAVALADAFTLYLPDRRGRGMSGPYGPDYGMRTQVEDLDAVLAESGAQLVCPRRRPPSRRQQEGAGLPPGRRWTPSPGPSRATSALSSLAACRGR
jgi:hypothetical protein